MPPCAVRFRPLVKTEPVSDSLMSPLVLMVVAPFGLINALLITTDALDDTATDPRSLPEKLMATGLLALIELVRVSVASVGY